MTTYRWFPSDGSRGVWNVSGRVLRPAAAGSEAPMFEDEALTIPAAGLLHANGDVVDDDHPLRVDAYSMLPDFQVPTTLPDVLYTSINGGPAGRVSARVDDRLDTLETDVAAAQSTANAAAAAVAAIPSGGPAGTPALRALGTSGTTAAAGNDARLSDARTPTTHSHPESDVTGLVSDLAGKVSLSTVDAKGDLFAGTADNTVGRLAVGADGKVLTAASGQSTGLAWSDPTVQSVAGRTGAVTLTELDVPWTVVSRTTAYTAASGDAVLCDATSGAFAVTLPAATAGRKVLVKKTDASANAVTITGTVDGSSNPTISSQHQAVDLVADGTAWQRVVRPSLAAVVDYPSTTDARYTQLSTIDAKGDLLVGTADNTLARLAVGSNAQILFADSSQSSGVRWGTLPFFIPYRSGHYFHTSPPFSTSTSNALGNGTLRLHPWVVPNSITISRIGAELTGVGEAGSTVRLGIYSDDGTGFPGALLLDAGTIDGTSATVQEKTVSQAIPPGLYWIGAAVQGAPTTQPTARTTSVGGLALGSSVGTSIPGTGSGAFGYSQASVSGALPANFTTISSAGFIGTAPRTFVKVT